MPGVLDSGRFAFAAVGVVLAASPDFYPTWQTITTEEGLPDSSIRAIHVDGGDVWAGTDGGLALREDATWRSWTAADGLPAAPVTAIDIDSRTGDTWLGTWGGGLVRFTGGRFDRFTQFNSGLAGDLIFDVVANEGIVWAATNGGISSFEPTAEIWGLYLEDRADPSPDAATALCHSNEGLFAGTWCGPLLRFDPAEDEWAPQPPPGVWPRRTHTGGGAAVAIAEASDALWWTTRGRLARRSSGDGWRHLRARTPGGADAFVNCLAARSDREAWLGTSAGLYALTDWETETWVTYRRGEDGRQGAVTLIRSGETVGTRSVASPLPDDRIRCLAFEGDYVWVGTPRGLARGSGRTEWSGSVDPESGRTGTGGSPRPHGAADVSELDPSGTNPWRGEARIGMLAPSNQPISRPGEFSPWSAHPVDRVAVGRAVARANARVGQSGKTFVLAENLERHTNFGWGTVEDSFAVLRHRYDVSGIVAHIDADARMDSALALHTEIPVVNFARTEPAAAESENPWISRCGADDPRRARRLLEHVLGSPDRSRPAVLATPGHETRAQLDRWIAQAEELGLGPLPEFDYDPQAEDLASRFEELRRSQADVLLTWAGAQTTATLVRQLRAAGLNQLVVGSPLIVNAEFIALAGSNAGAVLALSRCPHFEVAGDVPPSSDKTLRPAVAREPAAPQADSSFEAAAHLMVAIERAGPDREAVRETLRAMSRPVLASLEDGAWRLSALDAP